MSGVFRGIVDRLALTLENLLDVVITSPSNGQVLTWNGTSWVNQAGGSGSSAFNAITSGTNTTAAMVVDSGGTLGVSGSGTIDATTVATINGLITNGTNVTISGSGTSGSPYSISASGGGGSISQATFNTFG